MSVIRRGKEKGGGTIRMGREKRNEGIEEKKGRKENTNCIKKKQEKREKLMKMGAGRDKNAGE